MSEYIYKNREFTDLSDWVIEQAKKMGASDCKVRITKNKSVEINYRDRKPDTIKEATTKNLTLSVYINNRIANQSTPDFRKSTLPSFIQGVIDNAKIIDPDPYRMITDPKYYTEKVGVDLQLDDPNMPNLTSEQRHEMAKAVEEACLKNGGSKVISVEASENDETNEEYLKTSNGFEGGTRSTQIWVSASMTAQDEGDRRVNSYDYGGSRYLSDLPSLNEIGQRAAQRTLSQMGGKKIATETIPIIVENRVAPNLLSNLIFPMTGSAIQQKMSFLLDKRGQPIGSKLLTFIDDPLIAKGLASRYFDSDGFPAKKRVYIQDGVLQDYMIDWYYSRKLKCEPTSGSYSNMVMPTGTRTVQQIIKDLDRCILIDSFIGGNSNPTTGDFSIGIFGKLYSKGEFVQNVAEMNIADNHLKFWNKLVEVGNDEWKYGQFRCPSLVFEGVVVSGI